MKLFLLLFAFAQCQLAAADTLWWYYADGSVEEAEAEPLLASEEAELELEADLGGQVVTLDTQTIIRNSITGYDISVARSGQSIVVGTNFNPLGQLEIPIEGLVGRRFIIAVMVPQAGIRERYLRTISEGDAGLVGVARETRVPRDAPTGDFVAYGTNHVSGLVEVNNLDVVDLRIQREAP